MHREKSFQCVKSYKKKKHRNLREKVILTEGGPFIFQLGQNLKYLECTHIYLGLITSGKLRTF